MPPTSRRQRDEALRAALDDPAVVARYRALVYDQPTPAGCLIWLGAISGHGHGRFWLSNGHVIVAHRFAYALRHGIGALNTAQQIGHTCDEASCQNPDHLQAVSAQRNTADWAARRDTIGNPLRDTRGARGRAIALRDAARRHADLAIAANSGLPEIDRFQAALF